MSSDDAHTENVSHFSKNLSSEKDLKLVFG